MSKHTEGPWHLTANGDGVYGPPVKKSRFDGSLYSPEVARVVGTSHAEGAANARLIAAAPDLLKYAERALDQLTNDREEECWCYDEADGAPDSPPPGRCLACHLRDAIAKAKGE